MSTAPDNPGLFAPKRRADALDALRGFAILTMALSGMLHAYELPAWMFHAQVPPPDFQFDPAVPGLTWVDLVFPFFLFSMGAAMPLALAGRVARGARWYGLVWYALRRGVLLLAFAVYVQHIVPWRFQDESGAITTARWLWSLLALAVLFPALTRLPKTWPTGAVVAARIAGYGGAAAILLTLPAAPPGEGGFSWQKTDIILVVLAHVAVVGTLLWLLSRDNLALRMGFILATVLVVLGAEADGWLRQLWHQASPNRALLLLGYCKYLLIVLPGTIVGDLTRAYLAAGREEGTQAARGEDGADGAPFPRHAELVEAFPPSHVRTFPPAPWRAACVGAFTLALVVFVCGGLQARWLPWTDWVTFAACALGSVLFLAQDTALDRYWRGVYGWSVLFLVAGLLVEPFEGGIRKDHATLSYYFVTSGLAGMSLLFLSAIGDGLQRRGWLRLLIANGQNPMLAYVGIRNLLPPLLALTGLAALIEPPLDGTSWLGFGWAVTKTLLLALLVALATRLRLVWRT